MTDTYGGVPKRGQPKGSIPFALDSGILVILNAPPLSVVAEIMPPDWFPMHSNYGVWVSSWDRALHG